MGTATNEIINWWSILVIRVTPTLTITHSTNSTLYTLKSAPQDCDFLPVKSYLGISVELFYKFNYN
jgi:hypothetical protein